MELIEWRDEYRTGIAAVDHEHRELIETINEVLGGIAQNAPAEDVVTGLGEILARIAAHFALEEKLMREMRYPALLEHKKDHERLLDEICDILDECERGRLDDYRAGLSARLSTWFTRHFQTHDAELHRITG